MHRRPSGLETKDPTTIYTILPYLPAPKKRRYKSLVPSEFLTRRRSIEMTKSPESVKERLPKLPHFNLKRKKAIKKNRILRNRPKVRIKESLDTNLTLKQTRKLNGDLILVHSNLRASSRDNLVDEDTTANNKILSRVPGIPIYYIADLRNAYFSIAKNAASVRLRKHFESMFQVIRSSKEYTPIMMPNNKKFEFSTESKIAESNVLFIDLDDTIVKTNIHTEMSEGRFQYILQEGKSFFVSPKFIEGSC